MLTNAAFILFNNNTKKLYIMRYFSFENIIYSYGKAEFLVAITSV